MDWIEVIKKTLRLVEVELANTRLSPAFIARRVHLSETHLTRSFTILTGVSLSEYIRNRRLSVAGQRLRAGKNSVLEAAYDAGYESPEAFSKAFKRFHGVNPSNSKISHLKEFHPLQIKLSLTQERPLAYSLMPKGPLYFSGMTDSVPNSDDNATLYLWGKSKTKGFLDFLKAIPGYENWTGVITPEGYTIKAKCSVESDETNLVIPSCTWAIFACHENGQKGILQTWDQIYSSWMSETSYSIADIPQFEMYIETEDGYRCEIWIAVE